jgi:extracellular factor (EF) 3-hydroxypalmitic acid methyl ester biosynthesis protein
MQGLVLAQRFGYPGDFELLDRIYNGCTCADPALARWDAFFQGQPAIRALRNAKAFFHSWLSQAEADFDNRLPQLRLICPGGGPGRELLEYFTANPGSRVLCTYIDPDPRAVAYAEETCAPVADRIRFQQASPLGFQAGEPHLIWACGLFDYLSDLNLVSLLRRLWHLVLPGGRLVSGSFAPGNPSRAYLDLLGWRLHHRDASELVLLARQAGVPGEAIQVKADPEGVYLFLHLDKRRRP